MGRSKIAIEKRQTEKDRKLTYGKRKYGVFKKARELSALCDVDVSVVAFSPTGKPSLFTGKTDDLSGIVDKYLMVDPNIKSRRMHELFQILKKQCMQEGYEIKPPPPPNPIEEWRNLKEYHDRIAQLEEQINNATLNLRTWTNLEDIDDEELLKTMEGQIIKSIDFIRQEIKIAEKRQLSWPSAEAYTVDAASQWNQTIPAFTERGSVDFTPSSGDRLGHGIPTPDSVFMEPSYAKTNCNNNEIQSSSYPGYERQDFDRSAIEQLFEGDFFPDKFH